MNSSNASATTDDLPVSHDDVLAAAQRLKDVAHITPVMTSRAADTLTGATVYFKCENFQRSGAFKFRGAYNALASLSPTQQAAGVLAYSSGNHAQAIALAAKLLGLAATIVMPEDAPANKLAATRAHGAHVELYDRYSQDRQALAEKIARERSLTVIPPYDHPDVIAGQGTAALELFQQAGPLDALYICLGGGGLTSGCALAASAMAPDCEIIGVEPQAGNDVQRSIAEGKIVRIDVPKTIADGAQTQYPGELTFQIMQRLVSRVETVSDARLVSMMRWFGERMKIIVEPTGCLAAAAAFADSDRLAGKKVGVVISGGNVDLNRYASLLLDQPAQGNRTDHAPV